MSYLAVLALLAMLPDHAPLKGLNYGKSAKYAKIANVSETKAFGSDW